VGALLGFWLSAGELIASRGITQHHAAATYPTGHIREDLRGKAMSETDRRDDDPKEQLHPAPRSDIISDSPSDVDAHRRLEDVTSTLVRIMERLRWQEKELERRVQTYSFPFIVDEDFIQKLDKQARERLNRAGILNDHSISVHTEVRFAAESTFHFTTLEECLNKAGNRHDPEAMTIEWNAVLREPLAPTAKIQAVFTTEKPPQVAELRWFEIPVASIKLEIAGPNSEWVEHTLYELEPLFNNAQTWSMYRPLFIFRNRNVVSIVSWATGFYIQMMYLALVEWLKRPQVNTNRLEHIDRIIKQTTAEAKIDQLVREIYGPLKNNPILDGVWIIMGSFLIMAIITIIGHKGYPMLVPRAGINIGLAAKRYSFYHDPYKLIFVSIILLAFIIPLIRSWLFAF
jgi:hypothetical protein